MKLKSFKTSGAELVMKRNVPPAPVASYGTINIKPVVPGYIVMLVFLKSVFITPDISVLTFGTARAFKPVEYVDAIFMLLDVLYKKPMDLGYAGERIIKNVGILLIVMMSFCVE